MQVFSSEGEFLTKWYSYDENTGEPGYLEGIAASVYGGIYAVDASSNIVKEFSVDVPAPGRRKEGLTSSCMSTLVGIDGPIEVMRGQSVFPTGPDRANTSECQFSKPISTITLALVRDGKTAFEHSIQLLTPQRKVTFPLHPIQVPLVPDELEKGRYVRWVQATSPDEETIEISNDFIWIND